MIPNPTNPIYGRITVDPDICNGKPTIRGKRITVQTILEFLNSGETQEEILYQYPSLEVEDIEACLVFTSQLVNHEYFIKDERVSSNIIESLG